MLLFVLFPSVAQASIQITIDDPKPSAVVHDTVSVRVNITSTYEIRSAIASVQDRTSSLQAASGGNWSGTLSLNGLPRGAYSLRVRVEDQRGNVKDAEAPLFKDTPPVLHVISPASGAATLSHVRAAATCTDDGPEGCVSLGLTFESVPTAACTREDPACVDTPGVLKLERTIDVSSYRPGRRTVLFEAADALGQRSEKTIVFYAETGGGLRLEAAVPGRILDVRPDRILFQQTSDPLDPTIPHSLKIRDRTTGVDTEIKAEGTQNSYGSLTPRGAIYTVGDASSQSFMLYEWFDHQLLQHGQVSNFVVDADYAAWQIGKTIILRNLTAGSETRFYDDDIITLEDVGPNGEVLYLKFILQPLQRTLALRRSEIETDIVTGRLPRRAMTDGIGIAYIDRSFDTYKLFYRLTTSPTTIELASGLREPPRPGVDYQLINGWVAFTRPSPLGVRQIWLRSPGGTSKQISFFSTDSEIVTLSPNGEVAFRTEDGLYLSGFEWGMELKIASTHGKPFLQGGGWHLIVYGSLFAVEGTFPLKRGDVNGSGQVEVGDAVLALQSVVQAIHLTPSQFTAADVDRSNTVDVDDAVKILRVIVQIDPPFSN